MFHNKNNNNSPTTTDNYDRHIRTSQNLVDACQRALDANKNASANKEISVKDNDGNTLLTANIERIRYILVVHQEDIRILKLMREGKPININEFETVINLYDVRHDAACFCYTNLVDSPKPF